MIEFHDLNISFPQNLSVYSFLGGTAAPSDLILLRGLAQLFEECSYFEIGTWRGESILNLKDVTKQCFSLDLSEDELLQYGYSKYHIEAQYSLIKDTKDVTFLKANSLNFDFGSLNKQFDLIFIDGDHHWKVVKKDTENVFHNLVHDSSIVVWHDYTTNYSSIWWEVLYGILNGLTTKSHSKIYHVRNTNCLIYLPFKIESKVDENPFLANLTFSLVIDERKTEMKT